MIDDITFTHAVMNAESMLVSAVMAYYEHTKTDGCRLPPMLVGPCERLAAIHAERVVAIAAWELERLERGEAR